MRLTNLKKILFWLVFSLMPGLVTGSSGPVYHTEDHLYRDSLLPHVEKELKSLLSDWYPRLVDSENGGYWTNFEYDWTPSPQQSKFLVTQARGLWTAARGFECFPTDTTLLNAARHGFHFLTNQMWDDTYGGFKQWYAVGDEEVDNSHKLGYGNAFAIYGLAQYAKIEKSAKAREWAIRSFKWLDEKAHDPINGGYFNIISPEGKTGANTSKEQLPAISNWGSGVGKDQNSSIHLLEAFTTLYEVWPDPLVRERLEEMLLLIRDKMVTPSGYLNLFFTRDWKPIDHRDSSRAYILANINRDHISFGHDIETAYLLLDASRALYGSYDAKTLEVARKMVDHTIDHGFAPDFQGVYDKGYRFAGTSVAEIVSPAKVWWAEAEAWHTLGLFANLFPDDPRYEYGFRRMWDYLQTYQIDKDHGGWYSLGLDENPESRLSRKGHAWKGGYHDGRSLIQIWTYLSGERRAMTLLDVAKIKYVNDAVLSSDGNWIAYTVAHPFDPFKENKSVRYELRMYQMNSGDDISFVNRGSVTDVALRPGNHSVTFLNRLEDDNTTALYEIPISGGEAKKLISIETSINSYEWSPDGSGLLFLTRDRSIEDDTGLPYKPEIYEENLSFSRGYIWNSTGILRPLNLKGHIHAAHWSPDGSKIAVAVAPTSLVDDGYMKKSIVMLDIQKMEEIATVNHPAKLGHFRWNNNSDGLAFIAGANIHDPIDGRLFVFRMSDNKPRNVLPGFKGQFHDVRWIDERELLFLASEGTGSLVGKVNTAGSGLTRIIDGAVPNISEFSPDSKGNMALLAESPDHPSELFYFKEENQSLTRLTHSNPWLKNISLAPQDVISYKAKDGLEIEGILIRPLDETGEQKNPLIVVVHGGPESHYNNGWLTGYSTPGQVAAGKGYAVFYPNYRGSTGRGLEFTLTSQGDPAGLEFDDIVDGVDHLIKVGLVDKSRVGVTGGSYGGYATGWMSTKYSDRFAAGVMFVGISDKVSKWGTTDIPNEEYLVHARKWVYDDYEHFLERSPIYYAGQAKTPLLILAGKDDTRVHPSQSMELYRHIKSRTRTPVRLILYPGEGHGNRNASARYDYSVRMMGWFEEYLQSKVPKS